MGGSVCCLEEWGMSGTGANMRGTTDSVSNNQTTNDNMEVRQ